MYELNINSNVYCTVVHLKMYNRYKMIMPTVNAYSRMVFTYNMGNFFVVAVGVIIFFF